MTKLLNIVFAVIIVAGLILPSALTISADSVDSALVAQWHFEGNANDSSGHSNNGTVSGATFVPGKLGQALSFDGVDDFVNILTPQNIPTGNSSRTISACIKVAASGTDKFQTIVGYGTPLKNNETFLFERSRPLSSGQPYNGQIYITGWNNDFQATTRIAFDDWYFVVVTFNGSSTGVYVNGSPDGATNKTYNTVLKNNEGLFIGNSPTNDGWHTYFHGLIDEVCIYDRALTQSEISTLYSGLINPTPELPAGLLFGLGLAGVVGFIFIKRRNRRVTAN
jgi:trimeric autotransporter adhesin